MAIRSNPSSLDYESFLKQHDMIWDRLPNRWEVAPYTGNGNVGFLFYQAKGEAINVISIYAGRHDYYPQDNPVKPDDGKIHIKNSWSPEYPGGNGQDINFTIALLRWSCQTLVNLNREFKLNDPLLPEWQNILDNLVGFLTDENGLRIGKDVPFDQPHRHYSHLLGFYPTSPSNACARKAHSW